MTAGTGVFVSRGVLADALRVPEGRDADTALRLIGWVEGMGGRAGREDLDSLRVGTAAGAAVAFPGDWIVRLPDGAFCVLDDDVFGALFRRM